MEPIKILIVQKLVAFKGSYNCVIAQFITHNLIHTSLHFLFLSILFSLLPLPKPSLFLHTLKTCLNKITIPDSLTVGIWIRGLELIFAQTHHWDFKDNVFGGRNIPHTELFLFPQRLKTCDFRVFHLWFWFIDFNIIVWNCLRGFTSHVVRRILYKFLYWYYEMVIQIVSKWQIEPVMNGEIHVYWDVCIKLWVMNCAITQL